jgi:hypothetical protein
VVVQQLMAAGEPLEHRQSFFKRRAGQEPQNNMGKRVATTEAEAFRFAARFAATTRAMNTHPLAWRLCFLPARLRTLFALMFIAVLAAACGGSTDTAPAQAARDVEAAARRTPAAPTDAGIAPQQARQADALVDTMGINIHVTYTDGPYGQYETLLKPKLQQLGVRYVRDGAAIGAGYQYQHDRFKDLNMSLGIRLQLICDLRVPFGGGTAQQCRDFVKSSVGPQVVFGVEGPNEYDASGDADFANTLDAYTRELWAAFKSDAATSSIPIAGPSFLGDGANAYGDHGAFMDFANVHNYFSSRHPETPGWGAGGYGSVKYAIDYARVMAPGKPVISTETGWTQNGVTPVPEDIAALYTARLPFVHFNNGIVKTFVYELFDLGDGYGIVTRDGQNKPAFGAMENIIKLLSDPGACFAPDALRFELRGATADVQQTLLQKRDGRFYLALWLGKPSWDPLTSKYDRPLPQEVTVAFGDAIGAVRVATPTDGRGYGELPLTDNAVKVPVTDKVLLLEIAPVVLQPKN